MDESFPGGPGFKDFGAPETASQAAVQGATPVQAAVAAGSARQAKRPSFYRPELDALRFFAALMVFWDHMLFGRVHPAAVGDMGAYGVCIFFCLSAYLIVTLLLREIETTGTVQVRAFAARRMLRIWPLYFLIVAIGCVIGLIFPGGHLSGGAVLALVFLAGNVYALRHGWSALGAISPLWSISVEEQFYLVVPLITKLGARRVKAVLCAVCCAAIIGSYITLVMISVRHPGTQPWNEFWPNSFVQFQFFGAGGLIAIGLYRREVRLPVALRIAVFVGALCCYFLDATALTGIHADAPEPVRHVVVGYGLLLVTTSLVLIATLNLPAQIPSGLRYLGRISYGLYVFHGPIFWIIALQRIGHRLLSAGVVGAGLTFLCAAASYKYFETPFLRLKERFETVKTRPL